MQGVPVTVKGTLLWSLACHCKDICIKDICIKNSISAYLHWSNGWKSLNNINITVCDNVIESLMFGFNKTSDLFIVLNFCCLRAKYYIYPQKLMNNNKIDFFDYLAFLKQN